MKAFLFILLFCGSAFGALTKINPAMISLGGSSSGQILVSNGTSLYYKDNYNYGDPVCTTSSVKTPAGSGVFSSMTSGSLPFASNVGQVWKFWGNGFFTQSGSASYTAVALGLYESPGLNNGTQPTIACGTALCNLKTPFATDAGLSNRVLIDGNGGVITLPEYQIEMTNTGMNFYLVPHANMSTPANARITVVLCAQRMR